MPIRQRMYICYIILDEKIIPEEFITPVKKINDSQTNR